jgi:hypothetical protein
VAKKRNAYRVLVGKPEGDDLEDLGGYGMILDGFVEMGLVGLNWFVWLRVSDRWRAFVDNVTNIRVSSIMENYLTT